MSLPEFPSENSGYPESSQATLSVVLGILGILFTLFAPFAWWLANRELEAIDAGRRPPENIGTARTGRILGIIGTVLLALGFLLVFLAFTLYRDVFIIRP